MIKNITKNLFPKEEVLLQPLLRVLLFRKMDSRLYVGQIRQNTRRVENLDITFYKEKQKHLNCYANEKTVTIIITYAVKREREREKKTFYSFPDYSNFYANMSRN